MTTIQIEADVSTEQLLRAVEQLPPREFAGFLVQLRAHVHDVMGALSVSATNTEMSCPSVELPRMENEGNPYLAAAGMFVADTFAAEVDAYITAQREREREEAAREKGEVKTANW